VVVNIDIERNMIHIKEEKVNIKYRFTVLYAKYKWGWQYFVFPATKISMDPITGAISKEKKGIKRPVDFWIRLLFWAT